MDSPTSRPGAGVIARLEHIWRTYTALVRAQDCTCCVFPEMGCRKAVVVDLPTAEVERPRPPGSADMLRARHIVDSPQVIGQFAACEWDELGDDGKVWIAAIVREAQAAPMAGSAREQIETIIELAKHADGGGANGILELRGLIDRMAGLALAALRPTPTPDVEPRP
jgi:hypothetical protein